MRGFKTSALCLAAAFAVLLTARSASAQNVSRDEYIRRYGDIAVAHAEKYGIPASIKMAQGILESGWGNGKLAREGNTHFNIKVKASDNWTGLVVYADDDRPNEPFRAYSSPEESWLDHSEYLDNQPRYDSLFSYGATDYRSWARGLKNAGYATDPLYAEKLIRIIEDNRLFLLDSGEAVTGTGMTLVAIGGSGAEIPLAGPDGLDIDRYVIALHDIGGRALIRNSAGRFVVAREGDTPGTIAALTGVRARRLVRLNRIDKNTVLKAGQQVRIE